MRVSLLNKLDLKGLSTFVELKSVPHQPSVMLNIEHRLRVSGYIGNVELQSAKKVDSVFDIHLDTSFDAVHAPLISAANQLSEVVRYGNMNEVVQFSNDLSDAIGNMRDNHRNRFKAHIATQVDRAPIPTEKSLVDAACTVHGIALDQSSLRNFTEDEMRVLANRISGADSDIANVLCNIVEKVDTTTSKGQAFLVSLASAISALE